MTKSDALVSEFLNSAVLFPQIAWLTLLGIYLIRESTRRDLHPLDWLSLPPSMNLIIAVFVGDASDLVRAVGVYTWRRAGGGAFGTFSTACFLLAAGGLVMSSLCKIRAWTHPDYGHAPWLATLAGSAVLVAVLWGTRNLL